MPFGYAQQNIFDATDDFNTTSFIIRQMLAQMATMRLVRVEAVHGGGIAAPSTVDVLPLVNQIDGRGYVTKHGVVYGIPCYRLQGGNRAVVCDPQVGDIGYVDVSDRDISAVKTSRTQANPGSRRKFDLADGVYVGGVLGPEPTTYLFFKPDGGLKIADVHGNVIETSAAGFAVTTAPGGDFVVNGVSFLHHLHSGVITGGDVSGPPVP